MPISSKELAHLFQKNRDWAARMGERDPGFFARLARQQNPEFLWIGCSDSRVPANAIVGLDPGELFVHRNIANVVVHTDLNCLSVLQFAVDVLRIRHVIICGHYGCSGVRAALEGERHGLVDNWLRHVQDVRTANAGELSTIDDVNARAARLTELNVMTQVRNVARTSILLDAWARGQEVAVHGWIYDVRDGLLRDLGLSLRAPELGENGGRMVAAAESSGAGAA